MVATNSNISAGTIIINELNSLIKRYWQNGLNNIIQIHTVYRRETANIQKTASKRKEKDTRQILIKNKASVYMLIQNKTIFV